MLDRFDSLMATGESRHRAKLAARAAGERAWSFSDGRIHAFRTRKTYQAIVPRLATWCRGQGLRFRSLAELDARAEEFVVRYLLEGLAAGKSAWKLKTERPACPGRRSGGQSCGPATSAHAPQADGGAQ